MRLGEMYCWVSRMREICQSGLKRGEAAIAPPLLYWLKLFCIFGVSHLNGVCKLSWCELHS